MKEINRLSGNTTNQKLKHFNHLLRSFKDKNVNSNLNQDNDGALYYIQLYDGPNGRLPLHFDFCRRTGQGNLHLGFYEAKNIPFLRRNYTNACFYPLVVTPIVETHTGWYKQGWH